jgi:hypothetical protein
MQTAGARKLREDDQPSATRPALRVVESGQRRTVRITGQPGPPPRRRSAAQQRIAARPDRIALWAFLLGLFLVLMAAATANAAPL